MAFKWEGTCARIWTVGWYPTKLRVIYKLAIRADAVALLERGFSARSGVGRVGGGAVGLRKSVCMDDCQDKGPGVWPLEDELQAAVEEEDYTRASEVRDCILRSDPVARLQHQLRKVSLTQSDSLPMRLCVCVSACVCLLAITPSCYSSISLPLQPTHPPSLPP